MVKLLHGQATASVVLLILTTTMVSTTLACGPSSGKEPSQDRSGCKDCVVERMKYGCPSCVPLLHCMARCLWGGTAKVKCIQRCDCDGGKPALSDCKTCVSRCKCSCMA